ncbi:hypothetical protein NB688_003532 [Xanthomonas sacchari]|uniref:Uncharacterized protein n=1 Tax=Xanthomonas sacchari TaxID=56458 RepID=A0ABT3DWW6_9XANT|nr:hypothetical protein [Xanthomonas sacchari]MCW0421366.1 hypothetical protein [Xanthomonas sacchari]
MRVLFLESGEEDVSFLVPFDKPVINCINRFNTLPTRWELSPINVISDSFKVYKKGLNPTKNTLALLHAEAVTIWRSCPKYDLDVGGLRDRSSIVSYVCYTLLE